MLRCGGRFSAQTSVPRPTATSAGKGEPAPWGQGMMVVVAWGWGENFPRRHHPYCLSRKKGFFLPSRGNENKKAVPGRSPRDGFENMISSLVKRRGPKGDTPDQRAGTSHQATPAAGTLFLRSPLGPTTFSKMCLPTWASTAERGSSRR